MGCVPDKVSTFYFKLPYIGHYSGVTQKRIRHLIKRYCNNIDIKLILSSFKIGNLFSAKDPIPSNLRSSVVYKFHVQAVKLVTLVKPPATFQHAYVSI